MELPAALFGEQLSATNLLLLLLAAAVAGFVDAVVGGGGLVQLPALLLAPGVTPLQALATNKLSSFCGTSSASLTYLRRVRPDLRTALPMAGLALAGSGGGALCAAYLPAAVIRPIIIVALVAVTAYTVVKPSLGAQTELKYSGRRHYVIAGLAGLVIGFYDGLLGPGTGSFLVFALVGLLGYDFLQASAKAKIVNLATNFGALLIFVPHGAVLWGLGLAMGVANLAGGYLGARTAVAAGNRFVRVFFLVVVVVLIARLGWQVVTGS